MPRLYIYIYIFNAIVLLNCAGIRDFCEGGIKCFRASVRINGNLVEGERLGSFVLLVRI